MLLTQAMSASHLSMRPWMTRCILRYQKGLAQERRLSREGCPCINIASARPGLQSWNMRGEEGLSTMESLPKSKSNDCALVALHVYAEGHSLYIP
jgi:hypothetical protein